MASATAQLPPRTRKKWHLAGTRADEPHGQNHAEKVSRQLLEKLERSGVEKSKKSLTIFHGNANIQRVIY